MDGIVIGCSPTSNALMVYNPGNWQYYEPNSYRINFYHLPASIYADIKYNGGLFYHLTRVERLDPSTNILVSGTFMDILFPSTSPSPNSLSMDLNYTILFDNGTTASIPLQDMHH
jgi:hypothetical protein